MRLTHWLRSLTSRNPRTPRRAASPAKSFRPRLERLEGRICPSGGLLDPTFGVAGTVALSNHATAYATVLQPDGKIVSAGNAKGAVDVTRLNADGTLDTTFNGTGSLAFSVGGKTYSTNASSVALQADGKILVGATAYFSSTGADSEYVVARLNANGTLDTSFGSRGYFLYNPTARRESVQDLAVLSNGSILVGGTGSTATGQAEFAALRLTSSGTLDKTFGSGGVALVHVGANDSTADMAVVPTTGQVVLAGQAGSACLVVLTQAGTLDTSFNGTGYELHTPAGTFNSSFNSVAIQGNATQGFKIVVAGGAQDASTAECGLVTRFLLSGAADATFGGAGTGDYLVNYSGAGFGFARVGLEADGSLIVLGTAAYNVTADAYQTEMAVGHLSADGVLDASFGPNGNGFSYDPMIAGGIGGLAIDPATGKIVASGVGPSGSGFARFTAP